MSTDKGTKKGRIVRRFRIAVLGPSFVGKSQIVNRFVNNGFNSHYDPTMRASIFKRSFNLYED